MKCLKPHARGHAFCGICNNCDTCTEDLLKLIEKQKEKIEDLYTEIDALESDLESEQQ